MLINIDNLGQVGLISDIQPHALPPNAFSASMNVRFRNMQAERMRGEQTWHDMPSDGLYIVPYDYAGNIYWIVIGSSAVTAWDAGVGTDITPASMAAMQYSSVASGFIFNGNVVLNSLENTPYGWAPGQPTATTIPGWTTTWRAKVMASFKGLLMAFNLTESGTNYPTKYRWSSLADPGSLPASWDETDATITAGSDILDETQSEILAAESMGEYMVVYTRFSANVLQFVGGQFVLAERPLLKNTGVFAPRCVKEFFKKHFVVSDGEVVVHDGQTPTPILKGRVHDRVFPNVCPTNCERSFVVPNWADEEMWFCFPEPGEPFPNLSAAWSWRYDTWQIRELGSTPFINVGQLDTDASAYASTAQRRLVGLRDNADGLKPSATLTIKNNYLTAPEAFDNAAWSKLRTQVTADATAAPDGTATADKLFDDATAADTHFIQQTFIATALTAYTFSVSAKAAEYSKIILQIGGNFNGTIQGVLFDLSAGTAAIFSGQGTPTFTITAESDGWYRCSITATAGASPANAGFNVYLVNNSDVATYDGTGSSGVYVWGAQLEIGSTPTDYPVQLTPSTGTADSVIFEQTFTDTAGAGKTCTVERTGLQPEPGNGVWMVREVYPLMEGGTGTFYVGAHDSPNATPTYEGPYTFTPEGTAEKIDVRVTGRYLAWKGTLPATEAGAIQGMRFNVVKVGTR